MQENYNHYPGALWLVFDGHALSLNLEKERQDWTNGQKHHQALDAMGYSDDLGVTHHQSVDDFHARLARRDHKFIASGAGLLGKLKGGK